MNPPTGLDCPRYTECANADAKCHLCRQYSCFKTGASRGKGTRAEKKVLKIRKASGAPHLRKGSGAVAHAKGDIIDRTALYEVKTGYGRGSKSLTLQREWLLKNERESLVEGRFPVLVIKFKDAPDDEAWALTRATNLFDLLEERDIEKN